MLGGCDVAYRVWRVGSKSMERFIKIVRAVESLERRSSDDRTLDVIMGPREDGATMGMCSMSHWG